MPACATSLPRAARFERVPAFGIGKPPLRSELNIAVRTTTAFAGLQAQFRIDAVTAIANFILATLSINQSRT